MPMCNTTSQAAIERIAAFAEKQKWRKSRLAKEAELPDTTLRKFGDPSWNPTLRVIQRIEAIIPAEYCPKQGT